MVLQCMVGLDFLLETLQGKLKSLKPAQMFGETTGPRIFFYCHAVFHIIGIGLSSKVK